MQATFFEDPLNEQHTNDMRSSLTFSFPDSCINDLSLNFRSTELNLKDMSSPLFLPISYLTHDDLLPAKNAKKIEEKQTLSDFFS